MLREFLLTDLTFRQLVSRYGVLKCTRCEKPLRPNDKIVSINSNRKTKRYHKDCYEKLLH